MLPVDSPCSWSPLCHSLALKTLISYWKQWVPFQFIKMKENHCNLYIFSYVLTEMFINEEPKWEEKQGQDNLPGPGGPAQPAVGEPALAEGLD